MANIFYVNKFVYEERLVKHEATVPGADGENLSQREPNTCSQTNF